jgi:hypothetical protein
MLIEVKTSIRFGIIEERELKREGRLKKVIGEICFSLSDDQGTLSGTLLSHFVTSGPHVGKRPLLSHGC